MTSVANVSNVLRNQQPVELEAPKPSIGYKVNFKAGENDRFVRQNRQSPVYTQPPMLNQQDQMVRMLEKQEKKQKNKEMWNKIATGTSIAAGLAIIASVVMMLRGKGAGSAKNELDQLTNVPIKWTSFTEKKVAPLTSKTTSPIVREELNNIIAIEKLSPKAKKWAGIEDRARIYYMYGESAVGKTYAVKQFAQDMGAQYTCIKYGDLGSPFKDAGSMKILNMFKNVAETAEKNPDKKFVVCIDEVDALLRNVSETSGREASNARSSVLTGIDELVARCNNVTVVATSNFNPTNRMIDQASMRRFNAKILVPLPDKVQTEELLKMYLKGPEGIKDSFYTSQEFKAFVDELVAGKYANGEIETIAKTAREKFGVIFKDMPEAEIEKHIFDVKYLKDAKKIYGDAAAIHNDTMQGAKK